MDQYQISAWPENSKLALLLQVALEAWNPAEPYRGLSIQDPLPPDAVCKIDYAGKTYRDYGHKIGVRKMLSIFDIYGIKASFFVSGLATQQFPEIVKEVYNRGHEIVAHGWDQNTFLYMLAKDNERELIHRTASALKELTGIPPFGWASPALRCTDNTLEILAGEGFMWHGDFYDDDFPYPISVNGKTLVEIPHSLYLNDIMYFKGMSARELWGAFLEEFHYRYDELRNTQANMMKITFHTHISGRIPQIQTFEKIVRYARSFPGIWFAKGTEVARWCLKHWSDRGLIQTT